MPAARGVKRTASKASTATSSAAPKKKRGAIQLEIPTLPENRGSVFTCGQGDVGQLGLGEDVIETNKFKKVTALGDKIVAICAGGMHTVALDSNGKVWTYGCNDEGALGRVTSGDKDEATPKRVSLPSAAVYITAGDSHSAALLDNGDVYAWGAFRDSHGSMGLVVRGREGKTCREPIKVDVGETAADIASGSDHLVILTTSGVVYTMGCGEQGQLGRLSQRSASRDARQGFSALLVPSKVSVRGGARRVWAGYHATFLLHAAGDRVYACGLNNYSQLGVSGENRRTAIFAPTECDLFRGAAEGLQRVAAGQHHSLLLDAAGRVHAVGRCEYGRLGLGERTTDADTLEPVPKLQDKKCVSISAGTSNSFAVTDTGEVWCWGMGSEGQLGTGAAADALEPHAAHIVSVGQLAPSAVAAGGQHTVLLAVDPNAKPEPSPDRETETSERTVETEQTDSTREQEEEISSTSGAQAAETPAENAKPQKVNGDETKPETMDVDETENTDKQNDEKNDEQKMDTDIQTAENKPEKPESDSSSQDTDTDMKSQDSQESQDNNETSEKSEKSEISEKSELNGTEKVESKEVIDTNSTVTA